MGDLNELSTPDENFQLQKENPPDIAGFIKFVYSNGLIDIRHSCLPSTWCNKKGTIKLFFLDLI